MPGESKSERTKLRLLQAAAGLFASRSFETVSTRAIAKEAGVDAALIHHYFGSKEGLFQAGLKSIIRPEDIEAEISISSRNSWGRELVHAVDRLWASPAAPAMKALLRRSLAGHSDLIRDFVTTTILNRIIPHLDCSEPERHLRASLAGSQLSGLVVARHIVGVEPLASLPSEEVTELIGPVIQHYLTGPLRVRDVLKIAETTSSITESSGKRPSNQPHTL